MARHSGARHQAWHSGGSRAHHVTSLEVCFYHTMKLVPKLVHPETDAFNLLSPLHIRTTCMVWARACVHITWACTSGWSSRPFAASAERPLRSLRMEFVVRRRPAVSIALVESTLLTQRRARLTEHHARLPRLPHESQHYHPGTKDDPNGIAPKELAKQQSKRHGRRLNSNGG